MKRILFALLITLAATPLSADENPSNAPVWMMVAHEVEDYDAWRAVFDSGLSTRQSAGELSFEINRYPGFPNYVMAIFWWDTADRARAFVDDPAVRNAMKAAGVTSEPIVIFEKGVAQPDAG